MVSHFGGFNRFCFTFTHQGAQSPALGLLVSLSCWVHSRRKIFAVSHSLLFECNCHWCDSLAALLGVVLMLWEFNLPVCWRCYDCFSSMWEAQALTFPTARRKRCPCSRLFHPLTLLIRARFTGECFKYVVSPNRCFLGSLLTCFTK